MHYAVLKKGQTLPWGDGKGVTGDPIHKALPVGNVGGFRISGKRKSPLLVALYTSFENPDWPDSIDFVTGKVTYYGDNKSVGSSLTSTPRGGNSILELIFEAAKLNKKEVPPIFLFSNSSNGKDKVFQGLLVPGHESEKIEDSLLAIWKYEQNGKVQNYKATFSLLKTETVPEKWLASLWAKEPQPELEPDELRKWRNS